MAPRAPHIVEMPELGFTVLRIIQSVLAVGLFGLLAYFVWAVDQTYLSNSTNIVTGAIGVGLFSVCLTLILRGYYIISSSCAPRAYNYWAVLSLESLAVLFWLITFALLADIVAALVSANNANGYYYYDSGSSSSSTYDYTSDCSDSDYYCYAKRAISSLTKRDTVDPVTAIFYVAFALSVIEWVLFIVSLVLFSIRMHRHRMANYPMKAGDGSQAYTPKHMEAQDQPMPAPEYQGQVAPQQGFAQTSLH